MAAKKKAATKKGLPARRRSTAIANWDQTLEKYATDDKARTVSSEGNMLSIRGGSFKYQGQDIGDSIKVIILDFTHVKQWFDRPFDEDNPSTPACAAMSYDGKNIAPFEDSPKVQTESGFCMECWANEFGSADVGRAKACKDTRRVALIDASGDVEDEDIAILNIPPTSLKKFDGYISGLSRIGKGRPCFSVVTQLDFDADEDYPVIIPSMVQPVEEVLDKAQLSALLKRREQATEILSKPPFDFSQYEEPPQRKPRGKKGAAKKKAASAATGKKKAGNRRSKFS